MKRLLAAARALPTAQLWLITAFACVILLQIELVWNRPVNWDETFHLTEAHAFYQGRLTEALQVFYARAFFWLAMLPVDAVDQIRIARIFMLCFELFTTCAIYALGRRFAEQTPAALAALAYLAGGYVFQHGFSYRADPMAAAFLMGALWILLTSRLTTAQLVVAGLLTGLAALTTIKIVFYFPAYAGVAWLRWHEAEHRPRMLLRLAAFAGSASVFTLLFIGLTILTLPPAATGSAAKTVVTSGTMMFSEGLFPRWPYVLGAMGAAPLMAILVIITPLEVWRAQLTRPRRIMLFSFIIPVASIVIYRNSFPYYYAFILPPVLVSAAVAARDVASRIPVALLAVAFVANALVSSAGVPRDVLSRQKQVIAAAHEIFPQKVRYFDFPGMLADFPKANFFTTTWGMRKYWLGLETPFAEVLARETVPLLVVNQDMFERNQTDDEPAWELLPQDAKALREGFIPHWGPIWVAGRRFDSGQASQEFTIYTPGTYTLEGADAEIDAEKYTAGQTLTLARGQHNFHRIGSGEATLRWGDHLEVPAEPYSGGPVFRDF